MDVVYLNQADFRKALLKMKTAGGPRLQAAQKAQTIIVDLQNEIDCSHLITNHGETRIKHTVKYDLPGASRLVTIQKDQTVYLLFLGTHAEADKWIENNKGLKLTADKQSARLEITHVTQVINQWQSAPPITVTDNNEPYFKRIPDFHLEEIIQKPPLIKLLLKINEETSDDEIQEALETVSLIYPYEAIALLDMITELRKGKSEAAMMRWRLFEGKAAAVTEDAGLQAEALNSKANADTLVVLNHLTLEEQERLFDAGHFQDWMLFLHPDQKELVEIESEVPIILNGVSGSGKTCILVHRARYLVKKYPGEQIGIITLNRSLARLIQNLVTDLCLKGEAEHIKVYAFYDYFKLLLEQFGSTEYFETISKLMEPESHMARVVARLNKASFANEFDKKSGETLEDCWDDFTDQKHFKEWISDLSKLLNAHRVEMWEYLREEFSLVRSAFPMSLREREYLAPYEREGRAVPFNESIRKDVLRLLLFFQEHMYAGAVLDELELTQAVFPGRTKIKELPIELRFRSLLIDEYQDLSTLDLLILRQIPTQQKNGLFLAGDATQKVYVKSLRMGKAGMDILSARWESIRKNYRNSRQILKAATLLAKHYAKDAAREGEEVKILDPELAVRETCKPIAIKTSNQIEKAWELIDACLTGGDALPWSVCIATTDSRLYPVDKIIESRPPTLSAKALSGDHIREPSTVVVGRMQDVKGFEFSMVVIVGCDATEFPPKGTHKDEHWRHAFRLYVAMTRARDQVYLLYSTEQSRFLDCMSEELTWQ